MTATLTLPELAETLDGNGSARFVSILYRSKESGELARHTINLNVNRTRCLRRDVRVLDALRPTLTGLEAVAADELLASMRETLETGKNSAYTKAGYYAGEGNGNVQVSVKDVAYVRGYSVRKEVLEAGTYKTVKSAPKTLAKNKLRKLLRNTKVREFRISPENFVAARAEGKMIFINAAGSNLNKLASAPPVTIAVPVPA